MECSSAFTCSTGRRKNQSGLGNVASFAPTLFQCTGHLNVNTQQPSGSGISPSCCRVSPHRHKSQTLWDSLNSSLPWTLFLLGLLFLPAVSGQLGLQPSDSTPGKNSFSAPSFKFCACTLDKYVVSLFLMHSYICSFHFFDLQL